MTQGGYKGKVPEIEVSREDEMRAYDDLPKEVRDVLKDLPVELSAKSMSEQLWVGVNRMARELPGIAREYYRRIVSEYYF